MTDINKADQSATGLGIAARNPLPYTESNGETGQRPETVTDHGSLPQSLGELSAEPSGTDKAIHNRAPTPQKGV